MWIVGCGDLAHHFAAAGMLDLLDVSIAPLLVGAGKPLFTGAVDLELLEMGCSAGFREARYRVGAARSARERRRTGMMGRCMRTSGPPAS